MKESSGNRIRVCVENTGIECRLNWCRDLLWGYVAAVLYTALAKIVLYREVLGCRPANCRTTNAFCLSSVQQTKLLRQLIGNVAPASAVSQTGDAQQYLARKNDSVIDAKCKLLQMFKIIGYVV